MNKWMIIAVIYATKAVAKRKPENSAVQIYEFSYIHCQLSYKAVYGWSTWSDTFFF